MKVKAILVSLAILAAVPAHSQKYASLDVSRGAIADMLTSEGLNPLGLPSFLILMVRK